MARTDEKQKKQFSDYPRNSPVDFADRDGRMIENLLDVAAKNARKDRIGSSELRRSRGYIDGTVGLLRCVSFDNDLLVFQPRNSQFG